MITSDTKRPSQTKRGSESQEGLRAGLDRNREARAKRAHARRRGLRHVRRLPARPSGCPIDSPDAALAGYSGPTADPAKPVADQPLPVATSDSAVLDRCGPWCNLAAEIIDTRLPGASRVDLRI